MIELKSSSSTCRISKRGAFVSSLNIKGMEILKKMTDGHVTHGGMSILVPYADIVKNATYQWCGKQYKLPKNAGYENDFDNSIHGFVSSSQFSVTFIDDNSVSLKYVCKRRDYPSILGISINYSLAVDTLRTIFTVENYGNQPAPLQCGAHPYFIYNDIWIMYFNKKVNNVKNVYSDHPQIDGNGRFYIIQKNRGHYDDTFYGNSATHLITSDREIEIRRTRMQYFEVYDGIYSSGNSVAVEPLTGAPNSFNNELGLIDLKPSEIFACMFDIIVNSA